MDFKHKSKPLVAKDPNNCNKPESNINEFEQVPIKEKESSPPLQKFSLLPQKNNNNNKKIEANKVKEKMDLKQVEKRLKTTMKRWKKFKYVERKLPVFCK